MSHRNKTRRMDTLGNRIVRANGYRILQNAAIRSSAAASPESRQESGEAAPLTLLGGITGKNIGECEKFDELVSIIPSHDHLGKMGAGERANSIGIDWLQGTIPFEFMETFLVYMNQVCGSSAENYNFGMMSYQASCEWHPFGIKMAWDLDRKNRERHKNRILLVLTGSSLHCFPAVSLLRFLRDLSTKFWFKCSRIDLAFDDFEKIIRPLEVKEFADQGSYKGYRFHEPFEKRTRSGECLNEGVAFGSRGGGGKYLRCYAKDIESKGEIDAIRWEVEFSKLKANQVYFDLAMSLSMEDFATKIALFIGGSIDFAERTECGKFNTNDRLAFWEQILFHLGAAVLRSPEKTGSIETTMEWIESSVTPSLEKIRTAIGSEMYHLWLMELMGSVSLSDKQRSEIVWYWDQNGEPAPF